jgi:hypothetical protein
MLTINREIVQWSPAQVFPNRSVQTAYFLVKVDLMRIVLLPLQQRRRASAQFRRGVFICDTDSAHDGASVVFSESLRHRTAKRKKPGITVRCSQTYEYAELYKQQKTNST